MTFNEKVRRVWKDSVWSKVIAAVIIASFVWLVPYIINSIKNNAYITYCFWINITVFLIIIGPLLWYTFNKIVFYEENTNKNTKETQTNPQQELSSVEPNQTEGTESQNELEVTDDPDNFAYDWNNSDIIFSYCIAQTFPGDRDLIWYNSFDSVQRLNLFFENIKRQVKKGDAVWMFRGSEGISIEKAEILDVDKILLNWDRIKISRMAVSVSANYYKKYMYVEAEAEPPTGIQPEIDENYIMRSKDTRGYASEEYGEFMGKIIKRQEFDDGASVHDNNVVIQHHGNAVLRVRYLTKFNFILCAKNSSYNNRKFVEQSLPFFNNALDSDEGLSKLFDFLDTFQKDDRPGI